MIDPTQPNVATHGPNGTHEPLRSLLAGAGSAARTLLRRMLFAPAINLPTQGA